ncbi:hypothetical protein FOZ60_015643 [Perkinsus olseni]|uniref:Uncharacterized protein n=1 Tax=Perkinsus olseni TaxID=32597 RepID=A0A7J6PKT3_PEROL|nr:hypothetical protein FOZ60_015643 [Perkinsus olseni]
MTDSRTSSRHSERSAEPASTPHPLEAAVRAPDALEEAFELLRQQLRNDREREVLHLQSKVTALEAASRVRMDGPLDMQAVTQQEEGDIEKKQPTAVWNLRQELAEMRDQYKALLRDSRENASWRREKSLQKACRQIRVLNEQVAMLYTEMTLMQARGDNCCSPAEDISVVKPLLSGLRIILRSNVVQLENKRLKHELECANGRIRELLQEVETLARNRDRAFEELQRLRMTAFDRALRRRATGELIPVTPTRPRAEPEKKRRPVLVPRLYRVYMCILPSGPPPRRLEYNVNSLDVTFTLVGVALVSRRAFVTH